MKKPHWFRLIDLFTLAGPGVIALTLLIYAIIGGARGLQAISGLVLLGVTGLAFLAIWGRNAYDRKKWLDTFQWFPTHHFMIQPNGYLLPAAPEVENLISNTILAWQKHFPGAPTYFQKDITWVYFKKDLDEVPMNPAQIKVNGYTVAGTHTIYVDYDNKLDMLERTAFEHEIGHIIQGMATGAWGQDGHHAFSKEHGLK